MMEITQAELKEILHYDLETGVFRWRFASSNRVKPWSVAGTKGDTGYIKIHINKKLYRAHRLAWLYVKGEFPKEQIDHINGNRTDNFWQNLRETSSKQNQENLPLSKNNTSGYRGVAWSKTSKKWLAHVRHNSKKIHIGLYKTAEEAAIAAATKRAELFTHDYGRDQINFARVK
jgi:hypothetical protein